MIGASPANQVDDNEMVSEALELEREEAVSALFGIRKSSSQNQLASLLNQSNELLNQSNENASITPDSVLSDSFGKAPPSLNISGASEQGRGSGTSTPMGVNTSAMLGGTPGTLRPVLSSNSMSEFLSQYSNDQNFSSLPQMYQNGMPIAGHPHEQVGESSNHMFSPLTPAPNQQHLDFNHAGVHLQQQHPHPGMTFNDANLGHRSGPNHNHNQHLDGNQILSQKARVEAPPESEEKIITTKSGRRTGTRIRNLALASAPAPAPRKRKAAPPVIDLKEKEEVMNALGSKPQRGRKRSNLTEAQRQELTRTRNRQHAKSTRERKKAKLDELTLIEGKYNEIQMEKELDHARKRTVQAVISSRGRPSPNFPPFGQAASFSDFFDNPTTFEFLRPNNTVVGLENLEKDNANLISAVAECYDSHAAQNLFSSVYGGEEGVALTNQVNNFAFGQFEIKTSTSANPSAVEPIVTGFFRASFKPGSAKLSSLELSVDDISMINLRESGARLPSFPSVISFPVLHMSDSSNNIPLGDNRIFSSLSSPHQGGGGQNASTSNSTSAHSTSNSSNSLMGNTHVHPHTSSLNSLVEHQILQQPHQQQYLHHQQQQRIAPQPLHAISTPTSNNKG
ncbi:hypothetical protein TrVE_jg5882 [Triparma verrucosa]|uniref:BZIP domain-containing protein n=1 Tax=Triparma verrucosa TaxID=1606542 RepID=A0A9W7FF30_9STRA|nr:hypothetical protein TrVE_jg5882 [Triparma verrucosa]